MKKILLNLTLASTMLLSSGCMTTMLWGESPVTNKKTIFQTIKSDQLLSFGKIIQKNNSEQKFVVIGQDYLYVIEQGNEEINTVLNLKLSNSKLEIATQSDHKLRLYIDKTTQNNDQITFKTYLTLQWTIKNPSTETLKDLKKQIKTFRLLQQNHQSIVQFSIPLEGLIYTNQKDMTFDKNQKFVGKYAIDIGYDESKKNINFSQLTENLIGTPLALAADVIIVPFAAIGLVASLPIKAVEKIKHK